MSDPVLLPDDATDAQRRQAAIRNLAINAFDQLRSLAASAATEEATPHSQRAAIAFASKESFGPLDAAVEGALTVHSDGGIIFISGPNHSSETSRAITRVSQHGNLFDVDLNLSLSDVDRFTANAVKRLITEHLPNLVLVARQENAAERVTQLIKAIAPTDPLADVQLKVAESTMSLRREFLDENSVLTSAQVHANAGFTGGNPSQTVLRWRKQGLIFAISQGGREFYPAFQFGQDGRPLPIIAELLTILGKDKERSDWDNALWFAGDTGWLDGKTPIECLQSDPALVKQTAEQEVLVDVVDEH